MDTAEFDRIILTSWGPKEIEDAERYQTDAFIRGTVERVINYVAMKGTEDT